MEKGKLKTQVDFTPGGKVRESHMRDFKADDDIKNLLQYQIKRAVINLFKSHLTHLEDLQQDHTSAINKVEGLVDEDFIKMVDWFSSEKHGYYRKKTLDSGNEAVRDLENLLENFEIRLKK